MIITRKKNICIAVVLATVLIPVPLQAGDVEWVTDADGFWHESGNWSSDPLLPGSGDDVTIDRAGSDITVTHSQDATSIGNLLCTEDLTVTGGSITVSGAGHISGAITIQNSASFKADGADLLAGGATTLDGGKLYAIGGGVLSLPDAGAYVNPSTDAWSHGWLKADGADSALDLSNIVSLAGSTGSFSVLNIQGLNGGYVDLSSVSAYNTGGVQVLAEGSGGVVDLSTLTSMTPGPVFGVTNSITARNGGAVLMGNLAALDGVNLDIDGTGTMATAQIANYTNGIVTLSGAAPDFSGLANVAGSRFNANGVHLDLNHMTDVHEITIELQNGATADLDSAANIDGASFIVTGGGELSALAATDRPDSRTDGRSHGWLTADGAGSTLHMGNLVALAGSTGSFSVLNIQGLNGGYVDLSSVSAYNTGGVQVLADGSGGVVDLSTLTSMTPGPVFGVTNSITARNGGAVLMGNLAALDGVNLDIDGTGTMATAQIANYTNGIVTLSGAAPDFSGLANVAGSRFNANGVHLDLNHMTDVHEITIELQNGATADLGGATNIDGASFIVAGGTTLSIPAATDRPDSRTDGWSHGWLTADGAGSVLNLSNITGLAGSLGSFSVLHIEGVDGGLVDLRAVGAYTTGGVQILADGSDSVVDLSGLTSLATGAVFGVTNSITARNGGTVRLHPGQTVVADADVVMETGGTIEVGALVLGFGGKLSGNGQVNAKITGQAGSSIVADQGDMTIGDGGADDGFFSDGSLLTGANRVTINDRNEAVLGLLTEVGDGVAAGAIVAGIADPSDAHAHFLLEQGKEMVGRGLIIGHYKNHGRVIGDGTALSERIIFEREWTVTGRGSFEYVGFKGRFAPGDSPTIVSTTHAWYSGATVQIELGGLTPGSVDDNHDQINDTATVWLDLDEAPVLEILPWNGFVPEIGDEFVILTWKGGLDGVFGDVIVDPWFTARGLDFDLQYHNVDGAGDLTIEAIPEPATLSLIALGGLVVLRRRRR